MTYPWQHTGEDPSPVGGRPDQPGTEPIPEMVVSANEECQALVRMVLAWAQGTTAEECAAVETDLELVSYDAQLDQLQAVIQQRLPQIARQQPYLHLTTNLGRLSDFRTWKVAHTWPVTPNRLTRATRVRGETVLVEITREELIEHLDLAAVLRDQLAALPRRLSDR